MPVRYVLSLPTSGGTTSSSSTNVNEEAAGGPAAEYASPPPYHSPLQQDSSQRTSVHGSNTVNRANAHHSNASFSFYTESAPEDAPGNTSFAHSANTSGSWQRTPQLASMNVAPQAYSTDDGSYNRSPYGSPQQSSASGPLSPPPREDSAWNLAAAVPTTSGDEGVVTPDEHHHRTEAGTAGNRLRVRAFATRTAAPPPPPDGTVPSQRQPYNPPARGTRESASGRRTYQHSYRHDPYLSSPTAQVSPLRRSASFPHHQCQQPQPSDTTTTTYAPHARPEEGEGGGRDAAGGTTTQSRDTSTCRNESFFSAMSFVSCDSGQPSQHQHHHQQRGGHHASPTAHYPEPAPAPSSNSAGNNNNNNNTNEGSTDPHDVSSANSLLYVSAQAAAESSICGTDGADGHTAMMAESATTQAFSGSIVNRVRRDPSSQYGREWASGPSDLVDQPSTNAVAPLARSVSPASLSRGQSPSTPSLSNKNSFYRNGQASNSHHRHNPYAVSPEKEQLMLPSATPSPHQSSLSLSTGIALGDGQSDANSETLSLSTGGGSGGLVRVHAVYRTRSRAALSASGAAAHSTTPTEYPHPYSPTNDDHDAVLSSCHASPPPPPQPQQQPMMAGPPTITAELLHHPSDYTPEESNKVSPISGGNSTPEMGGGGISALLSPSVACDDLTGPTSNTTVHDAAVREVVSVEHHTTKAEQPSREAPYDGGDDQRADAEEEGDDGGAAVSGEAKKKKKKNKNKKKGNRKFKPMPDLEPCVELTYLPPPPPPLSLTRIPGHTYPEDNATAEQQTRPPPTAEDAFGPEAANNEDAGDGGDDEGEAGGEVPRRAGGGLYLPFHVYCSMLDRWYTRAIAAEEDYVNGTVAEAESVAPNTKRSRRGGEIPVGCPRKEYYVGLGLAWPAAEPPTMLTTTTTTTGRTGEKEEAAEAAEQSTDAEIAPPMDAAMVDSVVQWATDLANWWRVYVHPHSFKPRHQQQPQTMSLLLPPNYTESFLQQSLRSANGNGNGGFADSVPLGQPYYSLANSGSGGASMPHQLQAAFSAVSLTNATVGGDYSSPDLPSPNSFIPSSVSAHSHLNQRQQQQQQQYFEAGGGATPAAAVSPACLPRPRSPQLVLTYTPYSSLTGLPAYNNTGVTTGPNHHSYPHHNNGNALNSNGAALPPAPPYPSGAFPKQAPGSYARGSAPGTTAPQWHLEAALSGSGMGHYVNEFTPMMMMMGAGVAPPADYASGGGHSLRDAPVAYQEAQWQHYNNYPQQQQRQQQAYYHYYQQQR